MNKEYKLTIGIPTYNRKEIISEHIAYLKEKLPEKYLDQIEILVIDNNSEGKVYESLKEITQDRSNFSIYKNETNIGFAKNFLKLFEKAKGKYLMTMSDEDHVDVNQLEDLLDFLDNKQPVYSSSKVINGKYYSNRIKLRHSVLGALYFSCVIFETKKALDYINKLNLLELATENEFIRFYSQDLLATIFVLKYPKLCFYYPEDLIYEKHTDEERQGGLQLSERYQFGSFDSRVLQIRDIINFFKEVSNQDIISKKELKIITNLYSQRMIDVTLSILRRALSEDSYNKIEKTMGMYFFVRLERKIKLIIVNLISLLRR